VGGNAGEDGEEEGAGDVVDAHGEDEDEDKVAKGEQAGRVSTWLRAQKYRRLQLQFTMIWVPLGCGMTGLTSCPRTHPSSARWRGSPRPG